jgi:hypothetical protein
MNRTARRISYIFLCTLPFLAIGVVAPRALRIPGVYQALGGILFAAIVSAAWVLGARAIGSGNAEAQGLALSGTLLIVPWALISLLWVGIGAPFQATPAENYMRSLVLLASSIVVASAFVALKEQLHKAGEGFYSIVGFAASIPAGAAYIVCISMSVARSAVAMNGGQTSSLDRLGAIYSVLEFVACMLTYATTAAFAASLGRAGWLGRGATRAYVAASALLLLLLTLRGLSFPEISSNTAPWYTRPGVIAGIPAIPWFMPCLLGVLLLKRAGQSIRDEETV